MAATSFSMFKEQVGRIVFDVLAAYGEALGEPPPPVWEELPLYEQQGLMNAVHLHWVKDVSPAEAHKDWVAFMANAGWEYNEVFHPNRLRHPNMVPYDELPPPEQAKLHIARGVIRSLRPPVPEHKPATQTVAPPGTLDARMMGDPRT